MYVDSLFYLIIIFSSLAWYKDCSFFDWFGLLCCGVLVLSWLELKFRFFLLVDGLILEIGWSLCSCVNDLGVNCLVIHRVLGFCFRRILGWTSHFCEFHVLDFWASCLFGSWVFIIVFCMTGMGRTVKILVGGSIDLRWKLFWSWIWFLFVLVQIPFFFWKLADSWFVRLRIKGSVHHDAGFLGFMVDTLPAVINKSQS